MSELGAIDVVIDDLESGERAVLRSRLKFAPYRRGLSNRWQRWAALKQMFDFAGALGAAVVLLPVVVIIACVIKATSRGPVFFAHERIGRGGARFKAWKFRTMVIGGEELLRLHLAESPTAFDEWRRNQKLRSDPRVTRFGRWLRKSSLDELPQFWNVLRGEMSIVGPRPIVDDEVAKYGEAFHLYTAVKPGITGLWQVSGRNTTTYARRVELDCIYVRSWSPWLDFSIVARTLPTLARGRGAY